MRSLYKEVQLQKELDRLKLYKNIVEMNYFEFDISLDYVQIEFSSKFIELSGMPNEQIRVTHDAFLEMVHPDHRDLIIRSRDDFNTAEIGEEIRIDSHMIKYPGASKYYWIIAIVRKISKEKFFGVHVDVSNLKETQLKLSHAKEEYKILVDHASDLIVKFKPDGQIIYASPSYCDMYHIDVDEVTRHNVYQLSKDFGFDDFSWIDNALATYKTTQETVTWSKGDDLFNVKWTNKVVLKNGEIDSFICVGHDVTDITKINQKLDYEAKHDTITDLYNRRGLAEVILAMEQPKNVVSFLISINNYQDITDFYGYEIGALFIRKIGAVLSRIDHEGLVAGRLTEDKFVLLIENFKSISLINHIINQIIKQVNKNFTVNQYNVFVNTSIGYAIYPNDTHDLNQLISYSEIAAYESRVRSNKSQQFLPSMFERLHVNVGLSHDLKAYLKSDYIHLVYQEIIDTADLSAKYIETLVRFHHPTRGSISPVEFIDIAEKSGLAEELDYHIIKNSLINFKKIMQTERYKNTLLTINVTPLTLLNPSFPYEIKKLILMSNLEPQLICIEINENTFFNNTKECITQIAKLRKIGIVIALDDFGARFSSLSILDDVKVDIIKVDRSFVQKIPKQSTMAILKMIKQISNIEKKEVIIEGVETKEQVDILSEIGFNIIQGFYYSIPGPINMESESILNNHMLVTTENTK